MKKIISIAVCIIMTAAVSQSYAQHHRPHEKGKKHDTEQNFRRHDSHHSGKFDGDMIERRAKHLKRELNLNDKQYKKVVALGREQMKQIKKFGKDSYKKMEKLSDKAKAEGRKQFGKMREEYDDEMKDILSREQWEKYRKLKDKKKH